MKQQRDKALLAAILIIILLFIYTTVVYSACEITVSARSAALYEPTTETFVYTKNASIKLKLLNLLPAKLELSV